ncbi:hypothetical protein [Oricola cellulosilytica]|uniref:Uncharacterized protein n=1 Tax=Oricola cellulosilytica TaxID=1429082 RepID=A0A4R0P9L5_9HYPH|nr:hypothetical protein [Oricola cellulosilytica]TCD12358.1 hypothetical protein E0D97_15210 [Oricola cellulosilytica]
MSLPVLVAVVAIGIAVIVLSVHLSGGSAAVKFATAAEAISRFKIDFPEAVVHEGHVSSDGRDVVLELADGHIGLVHVLGSKQLTRLVTCGEMVATADGRIVELMTRDFTLPRVRLAFEDARTAGTVAGLFADAQEKAA